MRNQVGCFAVTINVRRVIVSIFVLGAFVTGCAPELRSETTTTIGAVHECPAEPGSPLDVAGEPAWRQYAAYTPWTDVNGCLIRIDVLAERPGPDHCGWADSRVMITGDPLGVRYADGATTIHYVRDPNGVYGVAEFVEGFRILEALPSDATDTGFRQGERELWVSPSDPDAIILKAPESVERWPRGEAPLCM